MTYNIEKIYQSAKLGTLSGIAIPKQMYDSEISNICALGYEIKQLNNGIRMFAKRKTI